MYKMLLFEVLISHDNYIFEHERGRVGSGLDCCAIDPGFDPGQNRKFFHARAPLGKKWPPFREYAGQERERRRIGYRLRV